MLKRWMTDPQGRWVSSCSISIIYNADSYVASRSTGQAAPCSNAASQVLVHTHHLSLSSVLQHPSLYYSVSGSLEHSANSPPRTLIEESINWRTRMRGGTYHLDTCLFCDSLIGDAISRSG